MVARGQAGHVRAHLLHHSRALMTQHDGIRRHAQVTADRVRMTYPGGDNPDQHLVGLGTRQGHLLNGKIFALGVGYRCLNFHIGLRLSEM